MQLVEFCESADSPGLLGAGLGVCVYGIRMIRIREALNETDRVFVLAHELEHARVHAAGGGREQQARIDADFYRDHARRVRQISDRLYPDPGR